MELEGDLSLSEKFLLSVFKGVAAVWNGVSFLPWYLCSETRRRPRVGSPQAVTYSNEPTLAWRNVRYSTQLNQVDGKRTIPELFRRVCLEHGSRPCFGTRELIKEEDEIQPDGKVFKKVTLGDYKWITYSEAYERSMNFGRGLASMGLTKGQLVVIYADTCQDWMLCAQGCFAFGYPVVTVYTALGDEAVVQGINESEASVLVMDEGSLIKFHRFGSQLTCMKIAVVFGKRSFSSSESMQMYSSADVELLGCQQDNRNRPLPLISPNDMAVIMYTSGSTGKPKGVMMCHENLVSFVASSKLVAGNMGLNDTSINYLPLAHSLELAFELTCITFGVRLGYSSPGTLSDQSAKIKKGTKGDISVLKPTLLVAVPLIMDRIRTGVFDKVKQLNRRSQLLFSFAYNYRLHQISRGYDTPILNRMVFRKIRDQLGGKVRLILSGGAPLSSETNLFMKVCFCCPIGQGYGLTETCGGGTICNTWDCSWGHVGPVIPSNFIRLVDWLEGGYRTTDKPHPRGEIIIGGPTVTLGYFKDNVLTNEVYFEEDGIRWFRTGDIGCMHADGCLKIVDRKKDLVKLSHGEYISLGRIESVLRQCRYVENCMVVARSLYSFVVLLVLPNQLQVKQLAEKLGIVRGGDSRILVEKLYDVPEIQTEVAKAIKQEGVRAKLSKAEMPLRIYLVKESWTPDNGLLTASMKIRRKPIEDMYAAVIDQLYQEASASAPA